MHEVRGPEGKTAAEQAHERYGAEPAMVEYRLPPELTEAETVGVLYDEIDGMSFWPEFALIDEAFANPELVARGRHRRAVLDYLNSPGVTPVPLRWLAERDPARASRVFAQILKRPGFSWERDGDALLRDRKASYFEHPPIPSVIPVGDKLTQASLSQTSPTIRRARQPSRAQARAAHKGVKARRSARSKRRS
jgi:hypothetical protein